MRSSKLALISLLRAYLKANQHLTKPGTASLNVLRTAKRRKWASGWPRGPLAPSPDHRRVQTCNLIKEHRALNFPTLIESVQ